MKREGFGDNAVSMITKTGDEESVRTLLYRAEALSLFNDPVSNTVIV